MSSGKIRKGKIILAAVMVACAILSVLVLAPYASSAQANARTIQTLDEKRNTVMLLTTATAVTSTAVAAIPSDATTPIAEKISDMTDYLMIVLCVILLEKYLLTLFGFASFGILIPAAFGLGAIGVFLQNKMWKKLAVKIGVLGLVVWFAVPAGIFVGSMIEKTHQESFEQLTQMAQQEEVTEEKNGLLGFFSGVKESVEVLTEKAENLLWEFIEGIAVLLVSSCVVPVATMLLMLWFAKALFGLSVNIPWGKLTRSGRKKDLAAIE